MKGHSLQAKVIARVLANRLSLPTEEAMLAEVSDLYRQMASYGQPIRYAHNQGYPMPPELGQVAYNDSLAEWASLEKTPQWRQDLVGHLSKYIFGRPETFRDSWTGEEEAAFDVARKVCLAMWEELLLNRRRGSHKALGKSRL